MNKKAEKTEDQFDGNLVCLIDEEMTIGEMPPFYFLDKERGKFSAFPAGLLSKQASVLCAEELPPPLADHMKEMHMASVKKERLNLRATLSPKMEKIVELLSGGRMKLSFLLNSRGGHAGVTEKIERIARYVTHQGGEVYSLADWAASGAAKIFISAEVPQNRFMLHDGELLFHISNLASGDHDFSKYGFKTEEEKGKFIREKRQEEEEEMRRYLLEATNPDKHEMINMSLNQIFSDPENTDNTVVADGNEAEYVGLATSVKDMNSLSRIFNRINDIDRNIYAGSRIDKFFER